MSVSEKIKHWRLENGLTQQDAAVKLGITVKTIWNWENGITSPPPYIERLLK